MATTKYFFSYSRQDTEFVIKLATDLKNAGASVWLDKLDIEPGTPWDEAIENGLNEANGLLAILSPASVKSKNVMDEVSYAMRQAKKIIPLMIAPCNVPLRLDRLQHIDFTGDYDTALKLLLHTIKSDQLDHKPDNPEIQQQPQPTTSSNTYNQKQSNQQENHDINEHKKAKNKALLIGVFVVAALLIAYFLFNGNSDNNRNQITTVDTLTTPDDSATDLINNPIADLPETRDAYIPAEENDATSLTPDEMENKAAEYLEKKDYRNALAWYSRAAKKGKISSMRMVGWMYDTDEYGLKNIDEAIKWYTTCAQKGNSECMWRVGYLIYNEGNQREGIKWLMRSAEKNDAEGMIQLAFIYLKPDATQKEERVAAQWLKKSMEAGNNFAKGHYSILMYEGRGGLRPDKTNALKLMQEAYKQTQDPMLAAYFRKIKLNDRRN